MADGNTEINASGAETVDSSGNQRIEKGTACCCGGTACTDCASAGTGTMPATFSGIAICTNPTSVGTWTNGSMANGTYCVTNTIGNCPSQLLVPAGTYTDVGGATHTVNLGIEVGLSFSRMNLYDPCCGFGVSRATIFLSLNTTFVSCSADITQANTLVCGDSGVLGSGGNVVYNYGQTC